MSESVLVLAAHPDDELGCGGAIAKHSKNGDDVFVMTFTNGVGARGSDTDARSRHQEFEKACRILGVMNIPPAHFADNEMDKASLLSVVREIEDCIKTYHPTIIYTHYSQDLNVDHRVVCEATRVACRPQPVCSVKRLLHFEVPCSTAWAGGFTPNYFVELDDNLLSLKLVAFAQYGTEVREYPHPRSRTGIEDLAHWRGASIGVRAAEAFMLERWIA